MFDYLRFVRIASSRTEIGADKNEYTAYIIVGSRISPFDSKITVCVKRFVELRTFASEIVRRIKKTGKDISTNYEFPYHTRLFGTIDANKLEQRRNLINRYLQDICSDENAVRHSYFLSFFDFNDGQYNYIDDDEKYEQISKYQEEEFRLKVIEETLEIIGMNGGIPVDSDDDRNDNDISDPSDDDNKDNNYINIDEDYFVENKEQIDNMYDYELNFEVPYDLHHYKNPEYKLVAAIFDIIQQQLEMEESYMNNNNNEPNEDGTPQLKPQHQHTNSSFMNSVNKNMVNFDIDEIYANGTPDFSINHSSHHYNNNNNQQQQPRASTKPKHARKHSGGGNIAPAPLKHLRATSIIESSFTPATPMEFHPSISAATGKIQSNINTNNYMGGWTANKFKNKFHSSIRGIDGGPRIIRTASEATSDRSLSYKIPTMVAEVWAKVTKLLDIKQKSIPILLSNIKKDLYPIIQEAMNDVAPIIKLLYNNQQNPLSHLNGFGQDTSAEESGHDTDTGMGANNKYRHNNYLSSNDFKMDENGSGKSINATRQTHGKYLSMFGQGYEGDEDDTTDTDTDSSEIRRSVGIRHFPFVKAMRQYCLTESRLYEFFLAFENLAIDQVFGDINIIFGENHNKKDNDKKTLLSKNNNNNNKPQNGKTTQETTNNIPSHRHMSSVDYGDFIPSISSIYNNANGGGTQQKLPHYEYIGLLKYNYSVLKNISSSDFTERITHIERIHNQINLILCEIIYAILKCMMKCLGDIILYKDLLEEKYASCGNTFDQDVISNHEDSLLNILRESGYNISFIVDDLKQKIKSEFKDYSSVIFNPLLEGISTIGEISLNCICLMISQFVFDEGEFPININEFRNAFISIWFEPIDFYIADFTECVFYILYQSSIGLVHSASEDLLRDSLFSYPTTTASSHSSSTWYQILTHNKHLQNHHKMMSNKGINIKKFIPKYLSKNISVKDILDLVIERTLTNIVDETLIFIKLDCEKSFFKKFEKREQRLFNKNF